MTDFVVIAPDTTPVVGTSGSDRLIFTLASGPGGTELSGLTDNPQGGYDGTFDIPGLADTSFTGIEHFTFLDKVGGDDVITTGDGDDVLSGRGGNDILRGGNGMNSLFGNAGRDRLYGGDDFDQLDGGNGNDVLYGGAGGDSLIGGAGNDRIFGQSGDDFIDSGTGNDLIRAGSGSDFIIAGAGDARIFAGLGRDYLEISQDGAKTVDGGGGRDFLFVFFDDPYPASAVLKFDMKTGAHGVVDSTVNQSMITSIEDYAMAGTIDVKLIGNASNNALTTDRGDDILIGNGGRDILFSGAGDDILRGNRGYDRLNGGAGNDIMHGGIGKDTFEFKSGADVIRDFKDDVDTIEIHSSLVAPGMTVQEVINVYGNVVAGNTVLTFDAGNVLTIEGLTNMSFLNDDMVLV